LSAFFEKIREREDTESPSLAESTFVFMEGPNLFNPSEKVATGGKKSLSEIAEGKVST
jgi:hypothetical protein